MEIKSNDDLRQAIADLYARQPQPERRFVLRTGAAGAAMFDTALKREFLLQTLRGLRRNGQISKQERDAIATMIKSPDQENWIVAESIMDEKSKVKLGGYKDGKQ
jgi:hypothetical protein